ncbi:Nucleotidyltransferase [Pholiota conissans]|uniref:polynucleotide adenylyltransferase n=1 Tax=Pholiota conissans TaxID=109636 RepID=A0A9P5ZCG6_9AGAR|nr:Nucleotidyltransferase [Pholiota conissans]
MSYFTGLVLKLNMMKGLPTRCKSSGDYVGLVIPPCGDFACESPSSSKQSPWLSFASVSSMTELSLHDEISKFLEYMEPTTTERNIRENVIKRFTELVSSFGMDATVHPFGSYVTGLHLPTSDIDMAVTFEGDSSRFSIYGSKHDLKEIMYKIQESGFASKVEDILRASVPLVRITDKITGIEIDLTCADHHGIESTKAVQKWMKSDTEVIKMLVMVVKMFLSIRRCGTTYTGGINSYVLVWMVVAWVNLEWKEPPSNPQGSSESPSSSQEHVDDLDPYEFLLESLRVEFEDFEFSVPKRIIPTSKAPEAPLKETILPVADIDFGEILMKFLDFYGNKFDYLRRAIYIEPRLCYAAKTRLFARPSKYLFTQHHLLSIYDPADASMFIDMGEKAYGIKHVQATFKQAHQLLVDRLTDRVTSQSILGELLGGDFTKFEEKRTKLNSRKF